MNGADALVGTLLASGVTACFANPGTSEMHFVAALDRQPDMACVLCLFEGGATGAADGYARMSGKVAATLLHLAPGFGNGFANIHNARKARSGMLNIMGEHAVWHLQYESPLRGNTVAVSEAVSHWTRMTMQAAQVAADGAEAIRAARSEGGQVATLILPANTAWEDAPGGPAAAAAPPPRRRPDPADVEAASRSLLEPGAALMVGHEALAGTLPDLAARIAAKTGCRLISPYFVPRQRRGAGSVPMTRLVYPVDGNIAILADVRTLVLCGADRPTAFFAYPGKPSLPEPPGCRVIDLCDPRMDIAWTLQALADAVGADRQAPVAREPLAPPSVPTGSLSPAKIGAAIGALLPEEAIVVDEAMTMSRFVSAATASAAPHDWLKTMGGAIGGCLPLAIGAAFACPDRKVVAITGDGSAMYTLQSLWTMAREDLDVTVIVFANRGYQVLHAEMANVGVARSGRNAQRMFDIVGPELDWVALAKGHGMVGVRVADADALVAALRAGFGTRGPGLIEIACPIADPGA
jgi:acetolactate synthase-1/2/3 large subunit